MHTLHPAIPNSHLGHRLCASLLGSSVIIQDALIESQCSAENFDAATLEADLTSDSEFSRFKEAAKHSNLVPLYERVFADQLTPVTAYRCLVAEDDREAPSFLFESVVNGTQTVSPPLTDQLAGFPMTSRHSLWRRLYVLVAAICEGRAVQVTAASASVKRPGNVPHENCVMVQGRYSFVGAQPAMEVVARENTVTVIDHHTRQRTVTEESDPMEVEALLCSCSCC